VVSLAPSYVSEFAGVTPAQLIAALRRLGFEGVSETALGAQQVSAAVGQALESDTPRLLISSACPVVVDLIGKYLPEHADSVTQMCSPLLAHCRMLRRRLGDDVRVVFIGPCIAKKREADQYPELLAAAISFDDLRRWLEDAGIDPAALTPEPADRFVPESAGEGVLYPVDGGMIAGIKANCTVNDASFMAFSGVDNVTRAVRDLRGRPLDSHLFLELLACEGGCVNGPLMRDREATACKRLDVITGARYREEDFPRPLEVDVDLDRATAAVEKPAFSEKEILRALAQVGKYAVQDELNCGGCGYHTCREFAEAFLQQKSEATMCVSYMRKLAQKKANALMQSMPSGVVIVQSDLTVVECNRRFAEILGEDILQVYDAMPGLEGAALDRIMPFMTRTFRRVLETGGDVIDRDVAHAGRVYHISVFTVERRQLVGGVIQDITEPAVQKEQVIHRAQDVIRRQMETVQKIAYLLGENAAESQVSLNSIIESFAPPSLTDKGDTNG
jgi:PAS domain-containing protein